MCIRDRSSDDLRKAGFKVIGFSDELDRNLDAIRSFLFERMYRAPSVIKMRENVTLIVKETEPTVKGQTAAASYKPAILTGGIKTSVPPFISTEDFVVINTSDSSYVEKAKK